MAVMPANHTIIVAVGIVLLGLALNLFARLHRHRSKYRNLPGPPHSYLFGSLISVGKVAAKLPSNAAPQCLMQAVKERYGLGDYFYVDVWPLAEPLLIMSNTDMLDQIAVKGTTLKHPAVVEFVEHFGGPGNLVTSEGQEWKKWRSVFNPGFASAYMMTMVGTILEEAEIFCGLMEENAKNDVLFRLEPVVTRLTVNVIGKVVLDVDLNAQKGKNELAEAFTSQAKWVYVDIQRDPLKILDPRRRITMWLNTRKMNRYISRCLEERFASHKTRAKSKHVVDLALEAYSKEVKGIYEDNEQPMYLDKDFGLAALSNMKTFMFAGHDTTTSIICYALYYLSKHQDMLARIRAEHDEVFGTDHEAISSQLRASPHLINKLPYTLAVIKEVLRFQPPASTVRKTPAGFILRDPKTDEAILTEGVMLYPNVVCIHRNSDYWEDPHQFNPDRFLPGGNAHPSAWIPFSKGSRNCIGQDLAMIEIKIVLAVCLRRFDFVGAYEEVWKLKGDGSGYPSLTSGELEVFGDRAYQIQLGAAKPAEGMPCRIKMRKQ